MEFGLNLDVGMKLEQKLTPQMIQSLKILQMNSLELETLVQQEMEQNPLLEVEENEPIEEEFEEEYPEERIEAEEAQDGLDDLDKNLTEDENVDWEEFFKDDFEKRDKLVSTAEKQEETLERTPVYQMDFREGLEEQLLDRNLSESVRKIIAYLIDCLDDDGYLRRMDANAPEGVDESIEGLEDWLAGAEVWDLEPNLRDAVATLQSFEPLGVGARTIQECLLLQANRVTWESPLVMKILNEAFEGLMKLQVSGMARQFETTAENIQVALKEMAILNPKPCAGLGEVTTRSVIPDLVVYEVEGELNISLNDRSQPSLKVNSFYRNMMLSGSMKKDEKKFMKQKLDSANWVIRSIDQRKNTIMKVMRAIVKRQPEFFEQGFSALKPMILQDVADEIEMHISTVNRVTNGKYVQTEFGVIELKKFFTSSVVQEDGSGTSSAKIKDTIKELVENESGKKPLSDQALADTLKKQGLKVARRTVAKYREQLGLLPARMRKKF